MEEAEDNRELGEKTIVFVDEIHRFNKAQQDAFLPFVEKGSIILIGATTENPSFEINSALLSRCKVFVLKQLEVEDIIELLHKALAHPNAFPKLTINIDDDSIRLIAESANGDARIALNTLEMVILNASHDQNTVTIDQHNLNQLINTKSLRYDKTVKNITILFPRSINRCATAMSMLLFTGCHACWMAVRIHYTLLDDLCVLLVKILELQIQRHWN